MRKLFFLFFLVSLDIFSQEMSNERLHDIYTSVSDSISGDNGRWQFNINDVIFISITDVQNNRMRIISPILESDRLSKELTIDALVANFHTALDVKYAISDGILWSVFIHPLKELTDKQVESAVSQVYYANINFGSSYASTSLVFPGREKENTKEDNPPPAIKTQKI